MKKILIIGQGIAGSCLALEFYNLGIEFIVVNEENDNSPSIVAAGLYNPVVLKKLNPAWKAYDTLLETERFYKKAESLLHKNFFYEQPLAKALNNQDEINEWHKKTEMMVYTRHKAISNPYPGVWKDHAAYGIVERAGYLNTEFFIYSVRDFLKQNGCYVNSKVEFSDFSFAENKIFWKGNEFDAMVFCSGLSSIIHNFFPEEIFKPVKGEVLKLKLDNYNCNITLNKGVYILPFGNNEFKAGSTYQWNFNDDMPSEDGKNEIIINLKEILKIPIEVMQHKAAIRPASIDRKPVLGESNNFKNVFLFTGLGTRGVMLAPWCAVHLAKNILYGFPLDKECDINRFR